MITMEFDDIRKIWDGQNNRPLYVIDEDALHRRILLKKKQSRRLANTTEWVMAGANFLASSMILTAIFLKNNANIFSYITMGFMALTPLYIFYIRRQRKTQEKAFESSVSGDLDHAISNATFQVRLSMVMRWYLLPIAVLTLLSVWSEDISYWFLLGVVVFFCATFYASSWEHRLYVSKKRRLIDLRNKLGKEDLPNHSNLQES
ncbi:hypothetical protein FNH22_23855 [Fulvivirga sp. M361]|uniref:hypothetical protein n=1 Tax=Fulvivirga sp. M361 TaxID=2594266 RepID=UPI00117A8B12|nr:hypothetical protein [Fulvivirga sp. M361]TRX51599.1 hypothetical protein FNH22_23855 [Fulvivirga sp. M361]